jgi:hypothetical protein
MIYVAVMKFERRKLERHWMVGQKEKREREEKTRASSIESRRIVIGSAS